LVLLCHPEEEDVMDRIDVYQFGHIFGIEAQLVDFERFVPRFPAHVEYCWRARGGAVSDGGVHVLDFDYALE
jgi:hypothetical protein